MAENVLETRILLRYDTLSNWMSSNLILRQGEAAIASVTNARTIDGTDSTPTNTPPAVGIKIGDGFHYFRELPWVQGIAGDVYNWAKQATKPIYTAAEIVNLPQYIEQYTANTGGDGTVTPRLYQLIEGTGDNVNKYYLQYKTAEDPDWITDYTHEIDLTDLAKIVTWIGNDLTKYRTLGNRTAEHIAYEIAKLDYTDTAVNGYVVTAVSETDGKISVTRSALNLNDLTGTLGIDKGGTGTNSLPQDQILVGHGTNAITGIEIANHIDVDHKLVPNYLIKAYVDDKTAGLTGAMHYIGEATVEINVDVNSAVNPQIANYDFANAQVGDVITAGRKEFVWTGTQWRLLGDEGSYVIKGSIKDADVAADADIAQSKIAGLITSLAEKVDKIPGKQLSTQDYTTEEQTKLAGIESGAQRNVIEHIFVNDIERTPIIYNNLPNTVSLQIDTFDDVYKNKLLHIEDSAQVNVLEHVFVNNEELTIATINGVAKSVNINIFEYTEAERNKLASIENNAQVNTIQRIFINGTEQYPNNDKELYLTLDAAALNLTVLEGARVPSAVTPGAYEDINIATGTKKLELARVAKTGNVKDLLQANNEYVTLYCGTSTDVI